MTETTALQHLVRFGNGSDYKTVEVENGEFPVYGSGGEFARGNSYLHDGESVLFGRKGTIDRPLYVNGKFWTVDTMYYTVPGPLVEPKFLYYWATTIPFDLYSTSTALPSMTTGTLGRLQFPLLARDDQRRIADYLDRETATIDALIAKQAALIEALRERRAASVNSILAGVQGPVEPLGVSVYMQTGLTLGGKNAAIEGEELPYLRVANIQTGRLDLGRVTTVRVTGEATMKHRLRRGDVLMTEGGDKAALGRGALWLGEIEPCLHQNHVFCLRPDQKRLLPEYLVWVLEGMDARKYFEKTRRQTTNLSSTNSHTVRHFRFPRPSVSEQREIAAHLDHETAKIDALIAKAERFIELAQERRAALITAAVTGQIEIPTED